MAQHVRDNEFVVVALAPPQSPVTTTIRGTASRRRRWVIVALAAWIVAKQRTNGGWRGATLAGRPDPPAVAAPGAVLTPARRGGRGTDWIGESCETNEKRSGENAVGALGFVRAYIHRSHRSPGQRESRSRFHFPLRGNNNRSSG